MQARVEPPAVAPDIVDSLLAPFRRFARISSAGGIVLLAATAVALAWANSPWSPSYHRLWETSVSVVIGGWSLRWTLHRAINDGLMTVFFFHVGLEIKREVLAGELTSVRAAALPMLAALGGMVVPAVLYASLNARGPGAAGWGTPMATDIAFALGTLALLGDRVPVGLKVFLAALAIVDDIGAVLVIALFYAGGIDWSALGSAGGILLIAVLANRGGIRNPWVYAMIGLVLWVEVFASGVHATIAGVLLAMVIPVRTRIEELESSVEIVQPPLIRIEHALHVIVGFGIMPLFALANAGVPLDTRAMSGALAHPVAIGVILGLLVGKPLGIIGCSWLAVRFDLASLPGGVTWPMIGGAGVLGGIGFTMALFIAGLAFPDAVMLGAAKFGILAASTISGVAGWLLLRRVGTRSAERRP